MSDFELEGNTASTEIHIRLRGVIDIDLEEWQERADEYYGGDLADALEDQSSKWIREFLDVAYISVDVDQ